MSQNKQILKYLQDGNSITPIEALNKFDCLRLAARISDLRDKGFNIDTIEEIGTNGKRYARYVYIPKSEVA